MESNSSFTFNFEPYDLYGSFYESIVGLELARRASHHSFYGRYGYVPKLPAIFDLREVIASELDRKGRVLREVRVWDKGLVEIKYTRTPETRRYIEAWGYFDSMEAAARCLQILAKHLPPEAIELRDDTVNVNFWNQAWVRGEYRPMRESQTISVPQWRVIAANYPERVRPELGNTMQLNESRIPAARLMLWRGMPGTGKTWAVRAMMREWVAWCTYHYVVDPAAFFSNSNYMLSLLSKISEMGQTENGDRKWSLIILEDAGEFITRDSRHQHGQALAKLLNLCDGLLGQGQKLLFLITTNEELQNLHPAIVRNGRCLSNLEFPEFSGSEADRWLESHGCALSQSSKKLTLSDLFAMAGSDASIVNAMPLNRAGFVR